mmetsp:Transcript_24620/g.39512  ORF Transcript_24620/g.39512 Transcript_24620/m.39512 type:complete len:175 (-) Transcript_24620:213-737(-)
MGLCASSQDQEDPAPKADAPEQQQQQQQQQQPPQQPWPALEQREEQEVPEEANGAAGDHNPTADGERHEAKVPGSAEKTDIPAVSSSVDVVKEAKASAGVEAKEGAAPETEQQAPPTSTDPNDEKKVDSGNNDIAQIDAALDMLESDDETPQPNEEQKKEEEQKQFSYIYNDRS